MFSPPTISGGSHGSYSVWPKRKFAIAYYSLRNDDGLRVDYAVDLEGCLVLCFLLVWDWRARHRRLGMPVYCIYVGSRQGTWEYFPFLVCAIEFMVSRCTGKYVRLAMSSNHCHQGNCDSHPVTPRSLSPLRLLPGDWPPKDPPAHTARRVPVSLITCLSPPSMPSFFFSSSSSSPPATSTTTSHHRYIYTSLSPFCRHLNNIVN